MRRTILVICAVALAASTGAQQPAANTEVYVAPLAIDRFPMTDGAALDISNNPGYDNQPSFTPDGRAVLFASNRDGKQTDIYRYDITSKTLTQLTHTPESEYSPLVTPDGKTFSVVRVEADNTQRLWRFDLDGSNPRLVLENVKGVGYHAWLDATHVALFILGGRGQANTLQLADTATGTVELIDSNPGRSLALRPGPSGAGTLTYVCKTDPSRWVVKEFLPSTKASAVVADALEGSEDLAWDPASLGLTDHLAHRLLMARGSKIFAHTAVGAGHRETEGGPWEQVGDFAAGGVDRITRLAFTGKLSGQPRLAFVAEPVAR